MVYLIYGTSICYACIIESEVLLTSAGKFSRMNVMVLILNTTLVFVLCKKYLNRNNIQNGKATEQLKSKSKSKANLFEYMQSTQWPQNGS